MRMRSAIALISYMGEVQKAPVIYIVALCCIFLSSLKGWYREALLKYHKGKP